MDVLELEGRKVTVVGLGRTGKALAAFLAGRGARITVSDARSRNELSEELKQIAHLNIGLDLGGHSTEVFTGADLIVVSPGVPLTLPALAAAGSKGVPIIGEIELAYMFLKKPVVAVTGTNGKSTTVELTAHLLRTGGITAHVGGNIGNPLIEYVTGTQPDQVVVVEVSSFQLETIEFFRPHWAVLLNLSPDHLDRYGSMEEYILAKSALFKNQGPEDTAVLNRDDSTVRSMASRLNGRVLFFSRFQPVENGAYVNRHSIIMPEDEWRGRETVSLEYVTLKGRHNLENVMAALMVARNWGVAVEQLETGLSTFSPLAHRMEFVDRINGVDFYDDSKGTNIGAVEEALKGLEQPVILILGGRDKGSDFSRLAQAVQEKTRAVVILGEAGEDIYKALKDHSHALLVSDLKEAVHAACGLAEKGDAVLLSPACASFDMFQNYAHRGRVFREIVKGLGRND